jgi:hypothetical protein
MFEQITRTLSIRVKYSAILAESSVVAEVLHFPNPLLRPEAISAPISSRSRRIRAIALGTSFIHDSELIRVSESDGLTVTARSSNGVALIMTNEEVRQIIMADIGF